MLRVKTFLSESKIHGIGLVAGDDISEGAEVWRYDVGFDFKIYQAEVDLLDPIRAGFFYQACYISPDHPLVLVICMDSARFLNFATPANLKMSETRDNSENRLVAARFIEAGEELTVPLESDADAARKLNLNQ